MDTTNAYRDARCRMTELARAQDPATAEHVVAACPQWTVRELLAHVAGVAADAMAGRLDGAGTDRWTKVQVDTRADRSLPEILDEWDEVGSRLEEALAGGNAPAQLVFDLATHEHDLRQAVGAPGAHDADSTHIALEWATDTWRQVFPPDLPPLRLVAGSRTVEAGVGEPTCTVMLGSFEALRALTGRRSLAQICAYDWDGDAEQWLRAFTWGPFRPAAHDLAE